MTEKPITLAPAAIILSAVARISARGKWGQVYFVDIGITIVA